MRPCATLLQPSSRSDGHALRERDLADLVAGRARDHELLDLFGDRHHLVEGDAAAVAGAGARRAAVAR